MQIRQDSETLTLRHTPFGMWLLGAGLTVIGLVILYNSIAAGGFPGLAAASVWLRAAFFVMSLVVIGLGVRMSVLHPAITTKIDGPGRNIRVAKNSLYRKNSEVYTYDRVDRFASEITPGDDGQPEYRLELRLRNGPPILISTIYHPTPKTIDRLAKTANDFMDLK